MNIFAQKLWTSYFFASEWTLLFHEENHLGLSSGLLFLCGELQEKISNSQHFRGELSRIFFLHELSFDRIKVNFVARLNMRNSPNFHSSVSLSRLPLPTKPNYMTYRSELCNIEVFTTQPLPNFHLSIWQNEIWTQPKKKTPRKRKMNFLPCTNRTSQAN